jgi:divalent metal cation (Fe/Co/Zn/Cd) transporter
MASSSKKVILAALLGSTLIAVTKFIAAALAGSAGMLSEGIHSVVNTGQSGVVALWLEAGKAVTRTNSILAGTAKRSISRALWSRFGSSL